MKRFIITVISLLIAFSIVSCKKEETAPLTPGSDASAPHGQITVPQERQIVVPETVEGKWASIVLNIEDRANGKVSEQEVPLGGEYTITGSNIKIKVGEFLPDFIMEGPVITSRSADPNNPAARITVYEGDEEIFSSWIYANHPAIHPFQHEKYGITLKEGKKAG